MRQRRRRKPPASRSRIDKDAKEAWDKGIFEMLLACYTQQEIAKEEGLTQKAVGLILEETAELPKLLKPAAEHAVDFEVSRILAAVSLPRLRVVMPSGHAAATLEKRRNAAAVARPIVWDHRGWAPQPLWGVG